jgi:ABC-2 type transport system permease protein
MARLIAVAAQRARLDLAGALRDPLLVLLVALMPITTLVFADEETPTALLAGLPAVTAGIVTGMLMVVLVARERFDGTLTRLRALPRGLPAYVVGRTAMTLALVAIGVAATLAVAVGAANLDAPGRPQAWLTVLAGVVLGAAAWGVIGIALAALLPSGNPMGAGSMLAQTAIMVVILLSADLQPATELPGAARAVVHALPAYWSGHLVRRGLLGDGAAASEPGEEWHTAAAIAILAGWTVLGGVLAAWLLRRGPRRGDGRRGPA